MKKVRLHIIAYCFVYITLIQFICNLIFLFNKDFYILNIFYLTQISGLNYINIIILTCVVFQLKYCNISRICAIAQVILSILWLVIQEDNFYNITAQLIIGFLALFFTYFKIKKIIKK
jgi:hypothetical protein